MRTIIFLSFFLSSLSAYDQSPPCYKDLEKSFFSFDIVVQALSMNIVMQGEWDPIMRDLRAQQANIPYIIREKTARMYPNPFDPKFLPEQAKQILLDTAYQMFEEVVYYHGYTDRVGIRTMFNYIISKDSARINRCFPKPKT